MFLTRRSTTIYLHYIWARVCLYVRVYLVTAVVIARDRRPDSRKRIRRITAK